MSHQMMRIRIDRVAKVVTRPSKGAATIGEDESKPYVAGARVLFDPRSWLGNLAI
jgi:hypothetical protein